MDDIRDSIPIRNKNDNVVAYVSVSPKEDMGKLEILLDTKDKVYRFKSPAELTTFIIKNFKSISFQERNKAKNFAIKRLRAIKKTQESAGVNVGGIGSRYSSKNEV